MRMTHKIMHGEGGLDGSTWFERAFGATHATRSGLDSFNVKVKSGRLELKRNLYSVRMTADWNQIPADIKSKQGTALSKAKFRRIRARIMQPA
jgi:hypothetical protein